jgi:serine/threonine-protein kinase
VDPGIANIGRYEIVRPLGEGGMGTVYLARDPKFNGRPVAIKLLRESFDSDEARTRFWREAQAAGQLQHPNIVTIFDWEEHGGRPFIAMEYIRGQTIARLIEQREPIPLTRRIEIIEGLCAGLACAHASGIIHRDIKPANVMVDEHGIVKILDFGIAKIESSQLTQLTMQQEMLGTLSYMSPEQLGGAAVGPRSDIFAASAVAYELLTGRKAFRGNLQEVARAIITADVPPMSDQGLSFPLVVERAVLKGLARQPEQRYDDATAMQRELADVRALLMHSDSPTVPARSQWGDPTVALDTRGAAPPEPERAPFTAPGAAVPVTAPGVRGMFGAVDAVDAVVERHAEGQQEASVSDRPWVLRGAVAAVMAAIALVGWFLLSRNPSPRTASAPPATRFADAAAETPAAARPAVQAPENRTQSRGEPAAKLPQGARSAARGERRAGPGDTNPRQLANAAPPEHVDLPPPVREPAGEVTSPRAAVGAPATSPATPTSSTTAPPGPAPVAVPPSPAPAGTSTLSPADEAAIRVVLRSYEEAFDNRSSVALKAVQPALTSGELAFFDRQFLENPSIHVTIVSPRITLVSATRARVDCSITQAFAPIQGAPKQTSNRAVIVLDKSEAGWLISEVRTQR